MTPEINNIIGTDLVVDIDLVFPNDWNPKDSIEENEDNKEKYEEIKREIHNKGLFEAITVRELDGKYQILDGYHRWRACKEEGYTKIRINTLGRIPNDMAKAITLIKEQKKVPLSQLKVADIVTGLQKDGLNIPQIQELLGLNEDLVNEYLEMAKFDIDKFKNESEQAQAESGANNLEVKVVFDSKDNKDKFLEEIEPMLDKYEGVVE